MAEGEGGITFKSALRKFMKTTSFLEEIQNNEITHESESKTTEPVESQEKLRNCDNENEKNITDSKCLESDTIELKQTSSNNEKLRKVSFKDSDELLTNLKALNITEKNSSLRRRNRNTPQKLKSSAQVQNFINYAAETDDNLVFSNEIKTEYFNQKTSEVEQLLVNGASENINNGANQHLFDAKVCDTSAQNLNSESKIKCPTSPTRVLIKQEHLELEHYKKLFICNFDEDTDTEELYYYFLQFGKIDRSLKIRKNRGRSKCIGYIIIFNNSDSITAVQKSEPHIFYNRTLKLYLPRKDGCEPEEFCKLFVGNLNYRTTEYDLRNHFQQWGKTVNCVVERKPGTNFSKCYGSVTFMLFSAMNDALVYPHHRIRGRNLKVELFQEREEPFWGFNVRRHVHSTKISPKKAKGSVCEAQKMNKKSSTSNKIKCKKEFLSEQAMLKKIEMSRVFKPAVVNYKLNDFDGAGVDIFKSTSISEVQSHNLEYISSSLKES